MSKMFLVFLTPALLYFIIVFRVLTLKPLNHVFAKDRYMTLIFARIKLLYFSSLFSCSISQQVSICSGCVTSRGGRGQPSLPHLLSCEVNNNCLVLRDNQGLNHF